MWIKLLVFKPPCKKGIDFVMEKSVDPRENNFLTVVKLKPKLIFGINYLQM
jgi:hypothetical protein